MFKIQDTTNLPMSIANLIDPSLVHETGKYNEGCHLVSVNLAIISTMKASSFDNNIRKLGKLTFK